MHDTLRHRQHRSAAGHHSLGEAAVGLRPAGGSRHLAGVRATGRVRTQRLQRPRLALGDRDRSRAPGGHRRSLSGGHRPTNAGELGPAAGRRGFRRSPPLRGGAVSGRALPRGARIGHPLYPRSARSRPGFRLDGQPVRLHPASGVELPARPPQPGPGLHLHHRPPAGRWRGWPSCWPSPTTISKCVSYRWPTCKATTSNPPPAGIPTRSSPGTLGRNPPLQHRSQTSNLPLGGMAERTIATALKAVGPSGVPGVRIPLPPLREDRQ